MVRDGYRYQLAIYRKQDSKFLGTAAVEPDWAPAVEWASFEAIRKGVVPAVLPVTGMVALEPVWDAETGSPYLTGVRVSMPGNDGNGNASRVIGITYFRDLAQACTTRFVESGLLRSGELFTYVVAAFPQDAGAAKEVRNEGGIIVKELPTPLPLSEPLPDHLCGSVPDTEAAVDGDLPVVIRRQVLDETMAHARRFGVEKETGGVLVGKLWRESAASPELILEITAQIPAVEGVEAGAAKLTFTADTWAAVKAALELRGEGEHLAGWWHSHGAFVRTSCRKCDKRKAGTCTSATSGFFSADDIVLHATVFGRPWNVALVVNDAQNDCAGSSASSEFALFGWTQAAVRARGYEVIDE